MLFILNKDRVGSYTDNGTNFFKRFKGYLHRVHPKSFYFPTRRLTVLLAKWETSVKLFGAIHGE